jgi:hypothetical protein
MPRSPSFRGTSRAIRVPRTRGNVLKGLARDETASDKLELQIPADLRRRSIR